MIKTEIKSPCLLSLFIFILFLKLMVPVGLPLILMVFLNLSQTQQETLCFIPGFFIEIYTPKRKKSHHFGSNFPPNVRLK